MSLFEEQLAERMKDIDFRVAFECARAEIEAAQEDDDLTVFSSKNEAKIIATDLDYQDEYA